MPITATGQGYGVYSASKRSHLSAFLGLHTTIVQNVTSRYEWAHEQYTYIDLNAGTGIHEDDYGSPLIFLGHVKSGYRAYFIEIETEAVAALKKNLTAAMRDRTNSISFFQGTDSIQVKTGDNRVLLPQIAEELRQDYLMNRSPAFGLIFSDENGADIPFDELAQVYKQPHMSRIDVLIYVSATSLKRVMKSSSLKNRLRLNEYIHALNKKHWQVRQPQGQHQWCFLFGTNWDKKGKMGYPELRKLGFFDASSSEGQEILLKVSHTNEELKLVSAKEYVQQSLFDLRLF